MASTPAKQAVKSTQTATKVDYLSQEAALARQAASITQAELAAKQQGTAGETKISLQDIAAQQAELRAQQGDINKLEPLTLADIMAQRNEYMNQIGDIKGSEPEKLKASDSAFASRGAFWSGATRTAEGDIKRADSIAIRGLQLAVKMSDSKYQQTKLQYAAQLRGISSQIDSLTRKAQVTTLKANEQQTLDSLQAAKDNIQLQEHLATIAEEQRQAQLQQQISQLQGGGAQKALSKADLLNAYRDGLLSRDEYVKALQSAGYSAQDAVTLANEAQAQYGQPGAHPSGPASSTTSSKAPKGSEAQQSMDAVDYHGVTISSQKGASVSNPDQFIKTYRTDYLNSLNSIKAFRAQNGGGTLSDYLKWLPGYLKTKNPTATATQIQQAIQTASWNISLAWYRYVDQGYPETY